jgi:hypothetical protein
MSIFAGRRRCVDIWAFVIMLLTASGRHNEASAAISLNQPLTISVVRAAREALNDRVH